MCSSYRPLWNQTTSWGLYKWWGLLVTCVLDDSTSNVTLIVWDLLLNYKYVAAFQLNTIGRRYKPPQYKFDEQHSSDRDTLFMPLDKQQSTRTNLKLMNECHYCLWGLTEELFLAPGVWCDILQSHHTVTCGGLWRAGVGWGRGKLLCLAMYSGGRHLTGNVRHGGHVGRWFTLWSWLYQLSLHCRHLLLNLKQNDWYVSTPGWFILTNTKLCH